MAKYIAKRLVYAGFTIFLVATITFFLMKLVPGGPFLAEKAPSAATIAALNAKYGLDVPVSQQYKNYMFGLLKGDMGPSIKMRGRDVAEVIVEKFPVSAKLGGSSIVLALCIGIPLGCVAALKRGKTVDNLIIFFATCGISVPSFVIATVLMMLFGVVLGWLPTFGLTSPAHAILPIISLSIYPTAYISRLMRSSMLDILGQDYMRTAKAKGVSGFKTLFKHALRNAIMPIITYIGPLIAYTLTGSLIVEKIFTIPGLGSTFITSINNRDYSLIMGCTIFLATMVILMNVVVDIAYKIVDPRIKLK